MEMAVRDKREVSTLSMTGQASNFQETVSSLGLIASDSRRTGC